MTVSDKTSVEFAPDCCTQKERVKNKASVLVEAGEGTSRARQGKATPKAPAQINPHFLCAARGDEFKGAKICMIAI